jgi:hypothetical protein
VRAFGIDYADGAHIDCDGSLAVYKMPIEPKCVAVFEFPELFGKHSVEGVSDHRQSDVLPFQLM